MDQDVDVERQVKKTLHHIFEGKISASTYNRYRNRAINDKVLSRTKSRMNGWVRRIIRLTGSFKIKTLAGVSVTGAHSTPSFFIGANE